MLKNQNSNILLLPPGSFDKTFFDFYLDKYRDFSAEFNIVTLDLPSRSAENTNALQLDGRFIADYINQSDAKWIILGMSTSAASLIEAIKYIDNTHITSLCLIFAGEFANPKLKPFARLSLSVINSNKVFRNAFYKYLKLKFGAYKRDQRLSPKTLLHFYRSLLSWKLPETTYNFRSLIIHAKKDSLIDISSRQKLEKIFTHSKVVTLNCIHEPSDIVVDLVINTLQEELGYLKG